MKKCIVLVCCSFFLWLFTNCSNDDNALNTDSNTNQNLNCTNQISGNIYPSCGIDFVSSISLADMDATVGNDSWGWTDPSNGKEYAIVCLDNGTAFIDI